MRDYGNASLQQMRRVLDSWIRLCKFPSGNVKLTIIMGSLRLMSRGLDSWIRRCKFPLGKVKVRVTMPTLVFNTYPPASILKCDFSSLPRKKLKPKSRRNLTIQQRRRPWKRQWKIDLATFQTILRLSKVREFRSEPKRGYRARVQTGKTYYLPYCNSIQGL